MPIGRSGSRPPGSGRGPVRVGPGRAGAALDHRRLKDADLTEKMAFFEAYGAVGGNAAVERLAGC
jgi:hypothetical protein